MMVCVIFFLCVTVTLFRCYSSWIITDINTEMLTKALRSNTADKAKYESHLKHFFGSQVLPGTKWCGAGNIADNYDDLGTEVEADMCCRDHDNCPEVIPGGETKHNLTNNLFYSRLSCHCDNVFHKCLKLADTQVANIIGHIYFNALQTKCFRKDYPALTCKRKGGWFQTKCLEYSYDTRGDPSYQFFDVKDF